MTGKNTTGHYMADATSNDVTDVLEILLAGVPTIVNGAAAVAMVATKLNLG